MLAARPCRARRKLQLCDLRGMHTEDGSTRGGKSSEQGPSNTSRESCVKYFDALWFCYSPVHQVQQYYRFGTADDCIGHWSKLYDCLKKRTKFADQVPEDPLKGKHPLWKLRTKEEAAQFWSEQFGGARSEQGSSAEAKRSGPKDSAIV